MSLIAGLLFLAFAGFWETKPPAEWTVDEVRSILGASPWAQTLRMSGGDGIEVHLATAAPMREAETRERAFQRRSGANDAVFEEYLAMVQEGAYIVLAVRVFDREAFRDGEMVSQMQKDTQMVIGKRKFPLLTHFPPSSTDPYLRLVFKRPELKPSDKTIAFAFMAPGVAVPYRNAEFALKEMLYRGKLEY